ncbi:MAG: phospho-sugar mutase [Peptoniphilaceae bacterium]|uniref:phospho-sugar mutase n=1 Tax=Parvimonas sp. TaxID=1944660 RepID=UPI0025CE25AA|nr:phospho-sugar mutase [Parvimonas sp.]MCI5997847.1 phospho-sugar mutase [Parvimonas sp.]MDD7764556.1 phospho-sugar mutase [Peptoniphilaceae bacterium]MDY3050534.1 phospho-sugar mutase [Parvimonas sp.]
MDYIKIYEEWLNNDFFDEDTKNDLISIKGNDEEIKDRFYKGLEFGTAGLRGKLGAGTNRMNKYMVSKAAQALAYTIIDHGKDAVNRGVAISYDVRYKSKEFAELTCSIMAANGIKSYIYKGIRPTPMCSYAIRKLNCMAGVMVTASHNPQAYNGYKAYWKEGSQILDDIAGQIANHMDKIERFEDVKQISFEEALKSGLTKYIDESVEEDYYKEVLNLTINDEDLDKKINVVYTPLNGVGNIPVREILKRRGFENVFVVTEQEMPDPDFTTVGYPNPEVPKAFAYSERLGKEKDAEILIATDPDCDRVALEVRDKNGEYVFLNGNRIGALLSYYIFSQRHKNETLPENPVLVKSIVTGDLSKTIAKKYGVDTVETLTGFKNICGKTNEYDITKEKNYVFGYEESIGFCYGTFVRDKDAVGASMMVVEMAAFYKKQGKSLLDVLEDIYKEFGYYNERQLSLELEGIEGQERIKRMMEDFRENPLKTIGELELEKIIDFKDGYLDFPKQNCLKYYLKDGSWYALRPSGTEPKIKLYIYTIGKLKEESIKKLDLIENTCKDKMNSVK